MSKKDNIINMDMCQISNLVSSPSVAGTTVGRALTIRGANSSMSLVFCKNNYYINYAYFVFGNIAYGSK